MSSCSKVFITALLLSIFMFAQTAKSLSVDVDLWKQNGSEAINLKTVLVGSDVLRCPALLYAVALLYEREKALPMTGGDMHWAQKRNVTFGQGCDIAVEGFDLSFVEQRLLVNKYTITSNEIGLQLAVLLDVGNGKLTITNDLKSGKTTDVGTTISRMASLFASKVAVKAKAYQTIFAELGASAASEFEKYPSENLQEITLRLKTSIINEYKRDLALGKEIGVKPFSHGFSSLRASKGSVASDVVYEKQYHDVVSILLTILLLMFVYRKSSKSI